MAAKPPTYTRSCWPPSRTPPPNAKRELRTEAARKARQSPLFFDLTLSLSKSISLFHASLGENARLARQAGDQYWSALVTEVDEMIWQAVHAGFDYFQREAGYTRTGSHGTRVVVDTDENAVTPSGHVRTWAEHDAAVDAPGWPAASTTSIFLMPNERWFQPPGHVRCGSRGSRTVGGHGARELGAGCHAGLPEDLPQVVVDRGGAQEQLRGDVPVALALADQPGDLCLLGR